MLGVNVPPQQGHDTDLPLNISSTEEACVSLSDDGCEGCVVMRNLRQASLRRVKWHFEIMEKKLYHFRAEKGMGEALLCV